MLITIRHDFFYTALVRVIREIEKKSPERIFYVTEYIVSHINERQKSPV